jgi:NAD+-dependent secondary alcohol dehydrogenase Adh1
MEPAGLRTPIVLGHESAGWVHEVGEDVTAVAAGDAVLVYPPYSCGLCVACRRGHDMHCDRHAFTGLTRDGGFADFVLVDERSLVPIPAGVDPVDVAPYADAGLTAMHAVKKLIPRLGAGTTAVVIGVGGVGHIALQLVKALGAATVVGVDTDERRRALARQLGADEVVGESDGTASDVLEVTDGTGAEVVIDFVGSDATHAAALEMLAKGGVYSVVGFDGVLTIPTVALVGEDVSIEGNLVGNWVDLWEILQMHGRGQITLKTQTSPLDEVNEVLGRLREGDVTGRAVLVP